MRALLLSTLALFPLAAQQDALSLLHQVVSTYRAAKSYHIESETTSELASDLQGSWTKSSEILVKDAAGRVRFETIHPMGSYAVAFDGKTAWFVAQDFRAFVQKPIPGPLLEARGFGLLADAALSTLGAAMKYPERIEENLIRAQQIGTETFQLAGKPVECVIVKADYAPPKGATGVESWTRTLWIDSRSYVILKEESVSRGKLFPTRPFTEAQSKSLRTYRVVSIDKPVPDTLTYTPPVDFREMDKLDRPRPGSDLIGQPAPDLSLPALTGETVRLADLRGKVVLLDFWATWCEPCRKQLPVIAKLHQTTKEQDMVIFGVNDDESPGTASKYLAEQGYNWPSLFDGKQKDARTKFKVDGIPTLVLIDRDGKIVDYQSGFGETAHESIRSHLRNLGIKLP